MYYLNGKKYFDSMTEAKMSLLSHLMDANDEHIALANRIKRSIENHEDINVLMQEISSELTDIAKRVSPKLMEDIETARRSVYDILPIEVMNRNPILGAVDTFLPTQLLLNPTDKMVEVTHKISSAIIATLRQYQKNNFVFNGKNLLSHFELFALQMIFETSSTYPGTLKLAEINKKIAELNAMNLAVAPIQEIQLNIKPVKLTVDQVNLIIDMSIERLESKDVSLLAIMATHCSYAYYLLKEVPMAASNLSNIKMDAPMNQILSEYQKIKPGASIDDFYQSIRSMDASSDVSRRLISDEMMYDSPLFKAEFSRGRTKEGPTLKETKTHFGLIRGNLPEFLANITIPGETSWVDWTQSKFEEHSKIVSYMVSNESSFISSYSGTTSLLSSLMIQTNTLDSLQEKQIYVQSILAYIASTGFHSIHEILAPLAYCLELIPSDKYPVVPAVHVGKGPPPLNHHFYEIAETNDSGFAVLRDTSWKQLLSWYETTYVNHYDLFLKKENVTNLSRMKRLINKYNDADNQTKTLLADLLTELLKHAKQQNSTDVQSAFDYALSVDRMDDDLLKIFHKVIPDVVATFNALTELNSKCVEFQFSISSDKIVIKPNEFMSGGYSIQYNLIDYTEKIAKVLREIGASDKLINHLVSIIDPTHPGANIDPISKLMTLASTNEPEMLSQFKLCLNKNASVSPRNDWASVCAEYTDNNARYQIISHEKDRQHLVILDINENKIIKLMCDDANKSVINDSYLLQKQLFEMINSAQFKYEINEGVVKVEMQNLGMPLKNMIHRCSIDELKDMEMQALSMIKKLHASGYVHGDITIDNFVYDEKTKKLSLIDFECAAKISLDADAKPHAILKTRNTNTTHSITYEPESDVILVKGLFLNARNEKSLAQNPELAVKTAGSYALHPAAFFGSSTTQTSIEPSSSKKQQYKQ